MIVSIVDRKYSTRISLHPDGITAVHYFNIDRLIFSELLCLTFQSNTHEGQCVL